MHYSLKYIVYFLTRKYNRFITLERNIQISSSEIILKTVDSSLNILGLIFV